MLLHGNARLTPFQRTLLCGRVRRRVGPPRRAARRRAARNGRRLGGWPTTGRATRCSTGPRHRIGRKPNVGGDSRRDREAPDVCG